MKRLIVLGLATVFLSGCFGVLSTPSGIREWGRYQNGQSSIAKMENNLTADEYHATQRTTDPTSLEALRLKLEGMQNGK